MAGIEMTQVPYRGASLALNDLIPGRVGVYFGNLPSMLPQARSGVLRGLAVTSAARSPLAPDIPTIAESGVPGFDVSGWDALFMPAKTPVEIVTKVHDDSLAALAYGPLKARLEELGAAVIPSRSAALAALLKSEMEKSSAPTLARATASGTEG
jgi:tripartite-type tricarboxylate transporter receptor subunit TctC